MTWTSGLIRTGARYWGLVPLVLWIPNSIATWTESPAGMVLFIHAVGLGAFFWLLWFALWSRVWLAMVLAVPAALAWPLELWVRTTQGTPVRSHVVALTWETGLEEAEGFLTAYGYALMLPMLAWLALYGAIAWLAWRGQWSWRGRSRAWVLAIGLPLLIWTHWPAQPMASERQVSVADAILDDSLRGWEGTWENVFPVNLWVAVDHYQTQRRGLQSLEHALAQRTLGARQIDSANAPELVVLIIGESASATHWGALGYGRDTTPQISAQAGAVVFSDVVALSPATRTAVPAVLSRRPVLTPDDRVDLQAEPSLVKAFSEVGYKTHWLSNQAPLGRHDTSIGLYARGADDVRFINPSTFDAGGNTYDEVLLAPLQRMLDQPGRHFVVVHLMGSHFDYGERYPEGFDRFQPSSRGMHHDWLRPDERNPQAINNSYDNSILYTDFIIGKILDAVRQRSQNSVVAYFSDHGVDSAIGACSAKGGSRRSEAAFRVPAFVWMSDGMRGKIPNAWVNLQKNKNHPYTTRAIYSTLLNLASIEIASENSGETLLAKPAIGTQRKIAYGNRWIDFDVARRKNACYISSG